MVKPFGLSLFDEFIFKLMTLWFTKAAVGVTIALTAQTIISARSLGF